MLLCSSRRQLHQLALDKRLQLRRQGLQALGPFECLARLGWVVVRLQGDAQAQAFTPEMWTQLMAGQGNAMQGMMNAYMEQSQQLVAQLQEQMVKNSGPLFQGLQTKPAAKPP